MSGKRVVQLGYGMQGKASLVDLMSASGIAEIIVADNLPGIPETIRALGDPRVKGVRVDASKREELAAVMRGADVVVELLPGLFALSVARLAVELGVNLVSTMYLANPGEQNPERRAAQRLELEKIDAEMKAKGMTILEEFGMDPGIDLVLGRKVLDDLDEVHAFHSYGAGFPDPGSANNPIHYKFTWSIIGVMRSYLRPAKIIRAGKDVTVPADEMFAPRLRTSSICRRWAVRWNVSRTGTAATTLICSAYGQTVKSMGRYICRWPGHAAFWGTMAKCGFLSDDPIQVGDTKVAPTAFCAALLGRQTQFSYGPEERDIALIRTDARGIKNGRPTRVVYQIVDKRDLSSGFTAMQRTVGFPASIGAQMILDGRLSKKGIVSPGEVDFEGFMKELGKRGITMSRKESAWDGNLEP